MQQSPRESHAYKVEIPAFSGPLDLLLHLIERNELDITGLSLAMVADQYLAQIESMKSNRLQNLLDFLEIAAKLLVIKSRALLPQTYNDLSIEEEEEDPAESLARQLQYYKQFRLAAGWLKEREVKGLHSYLRVAPPPILEQAIDMTGITVESLISALQVALERAEFMDDSVSVVIERPSITIESQITKLRNNLSHSRRVRFSDLLSDKITWLEISVTLLALLELIKRHEVNAYQKELFGPIEIFALEFED